MYEAFNPDARDVDGRVGGFVPERFELHETRDDLAVYNAAAGKLYLIEEEQEDLFNSYRVVYSPNPAIRITENLPTADGAFPIDERIITQDYESLVNIDGDDIPGFAEEGVEILDFELRDVISRIRWADKYRTDEGENLAYNAVKAKEEFNGQEVQGLLEGEPEGPDEHDLEAETQGRVKDSGPVKGRRSFRHH